MRRRGCTYAGANDATDHCAADRRNARQNRAGNSARTGADCTTSNGPLTPSVAASGDNKHQRHRHHHRFKLGHA